MSDAEPRPIDLRAKEFESPPDAPFSNDRLNRKESVESLCSVMQNADGPLVVSVEGAYGTGKSSYLRMCAAHLEQGEVATVEFNAWQQGHTGRPLIDLVAALSANLDGRGSWAEVKTTAKQVGWRMAGALTKGIVAPNEPSDLSVFDDWLNIDSGVSKFKESLHSQVQECGGKLVIFVDELDRCEPTYALDLLNRARHLFDVLGVVIVFGVNRAELEHAVQTQYGPRCDVDGYLRRFVDLSMQLRPPTTEEWVAYMTHMCSTLSDCSPVLQDAERITRQLLALLASNSGGRLRDIEQIVRHANLSLPPLNYREIWPLFVICLLTLRYVDRDAYERYFAGQADEWELLQTMREHLPKDDSLRQLAMLDAIVLLLPSEGSIPLDKDEFVSQYTSVRMGKTEDAHEALRWYGNFGRGAHWFNPGARETLHKTIEIAASA